MRATTLLRQQTAELDQRLRDGIADVTDAEWHTRAAPNTNLIGFIYWHVVRTQDVVVQTLIRGEPELITREAWAGMSGLSAGGNHGIGTGISLAQADAIALATNRDSMQAYSVAGFAMTCDWLETLTDDELDHRPDCLAHIAAIPAYQTALWYQIAQAFAAKSIAEILGYYCIAHPYQHLAEIGLLTQLLRGES
jgi:DinB superfamily